MKKQKTKLKLCWICLLSVLSLLLYWVWLLNVTQSATSNNTYQCQESEYAVEIRLAYHRGSDKLFILTQNGRYMLDTGWANENKTNELAERLRAANQPVTLTVWEHFPKWIFDLDAGSFKVRQIVDIRNNSNVFWDIDEHNSYQQNERISGMVVGVVFSPIIMLFVFINWIATKRRRCRNKKDK